MGRPDAGRHAAHAARALLGIALALLLTSTLSAGSSYEVKDKNQIYYGDPDSFSKPAVLTASTVFDSIKEYKEIKDRKIKPDDPDYWILLNRANKRFYKAVKKTAEDKSYDLMGESGSIEAKDGAALPDATSDVVAAVDNTGDA